MVCIELRRSTNSQKLRSFTIPSILIMAMTRRKFREYFVGHAFTYVKLIATFALKRELVHLPDQERPLYCEETFASRHFNHQHNNVDPFFLVTNVQLISMPNNMYQPMQWCLTATKPNMLFSVQSMNVKMYKSKTKWCDKRKKVCVKISLACRQFTVCTCWYIVTVRNI